MITFAVTAYNESLRGRTPFQWIRECITPALSHNYVSEILVYDDGSDDYPQLYHTLKNYPKINMHFGEQNLGVFGAKLESVFRTENEWVMMADSDNVFDSAYLDRLERMDRLSDRTFVCPSFGLPMLDYRHCVGMWSMDNIGRLSRMKAFDCVVNTGNQFVNRETFMTLFAPYRGPRFDLKLPDYLNVGDRSNIRWRKIYDACDSLIINSIALKADVSLWVAPELTYTHGSLMPEHKNIMPSSWEQAPPEKEQLSKILIQELLR